jgi:hypothetical protein
MGGGSAGVYACVAAALGTARTVVDTGPVEAERVRFAGTVTSAAVRDRSRRVSAFAATDDLRLGAVERRLSLRQRASAALGFAARRNTEPGHTEKNKKDDAG